MFYEGFFLYILNSWTEYYPGALVKPSIQTGIRNNQYSHSTSGDLYVSKVMFKDLGETQANGGAINVKAAIKVLIESTSFFHCQSKLDGGAMNFEGALGSVLNKICSNDCSSAQKYHFCYLETKIGKEPKNYVDHSSIANLTSTTDVTDNFNLYYGDIRLEYDNISKNKCHSYTAYCCDASGPSHISYTSFEDNKATPGEGIIYFNTQQVYEMNMCNVINNDAKSDLSGIICAYGTLNIKNSYLKNNNIGKKMFVSASGKSDVVLTKCYIDNTNQANIKIDQIEKNVNENPNDLYNSHNDECIFGLSPKTKEKKCSPKKCKMIMYYPRIFLSII